NTVGRLSERCISPPRACRDSSRTTQAQGVALLEKRNRALPLMPALAVGLALAAPVSTLALLAGLFSGLLAGWGARPPVSTSTEAKAMPWVLGCRAAWAGALPMILSCLKTLRSNSSGVKGLVR